MIDIDHLRQWIGRTDESDDLVTASAAGGLAATLDRREPRPRNGDPLPPLAHWLFFLAQAPQSELDGDGHPKRGGFLPPVPLPRRMFAGARMQFHAPLRIGESIRRISRIANVSHKEGRSGVLVFVLVHHDIHAGGELRVTEEQDIVYRDEAPTAHAAAPSSTVIESPAAATELPGHWRRRILPDPVMLFRFSALTFNGHRIHYDRPYAMGTEGYPGLVVHGPLTAMLLADLCRRARPDAAIERFSFRAVRPIFDTAPFHIEGLPDAQGRTVQLRARNPDGSVAMEAEAQFAAAAR